MKFRFHVVALAALAAAACSDVSTAPSGLTATGAPGANLWLGDAQPPVVTPIVTGGALSPSGWYFDGTVSVTWSITSDLEVTSESGCEAQEVSTDTPGITFTCTAVSLAGTTTQSVTIKRDVLPPIVTLANNGSTYTVDQTVNIVCTAVDVTSGMSSPDCPGATGEAWSYGLGEHLGITMATDIAGNGIVHHIRFLVIATPESVCNLAKRWVTPAGSANSLCQHLAAGRMEQFQRMLDGLVNRGGISSADAATLVGFANAM